VETVAEQPDDENWTCEIRLKDGRLPDLRKLHQHIRGMGVGASLRGVEVTLGGRVVEESGEVMLRLDGTGETVRLGPLKQKVQWNKNRKRARVPTAEERSAYSRLMGAMRGTSLTVTGPLNPGREAEPHMLEVRQFRASSPAAQ
jgi:hypothetical protein